MRNFNKKFRATLLDPPNLGSAAPLGHIKTARHHTSKSKNIRLITKNVRIKSLRFTEVRSWKLCLFMTFRKDSGFYFICFFNLHDLICLIFYLIQPIWFNWRLHWRTRHTLSLGRWMSDGSPYCENATRTSPSVTVYGSPPVWGARGGARSGIGD